MVKKYVPAIEHSADGFAVPVMTEKRFGYVKVEDYDTLAAEVERMRDTFLALSVARAERDQIAAENAVLRSRLAEAERLLHSTRLALIEVAEHSDFEEGAEFGIRSCCHVRDYKPHAKSCAVIQSITSIDTFFAADSAPAAGRIAVEDFNDLRKWIQERMQGGCRVFSKGGECRCPLCLLERIAEGRLPLKEADE